jgi:hypothetical protein
MFGFQTLACLHDIPLIRSSTNTLQDVYSKAKDTSVLIRFPCNIAEIIADKSLKIAVTVANPLVKPFRESVRVIDDFAVEKFRQMEAKYPVINTSTKEVMNTLNEKSEPVRHVINTVKGTTTSTIQHGKDTVSNVTTATVNKATNVVDTVYTFCETHVPGKTVPVYRYDFGRRTKLLWERIKSTVGLPVDYVLTWFRLLIVSFLIKIKQTNDTVLNQIQQKPFLSLLPIRLLIFTGAILEYVTARIRPNDRTEIKQTRVLQQKQFVSRQTLKPGALVTTRQSVVVTKQDTVITQNGIIKPQVDAHFTAGHAQQSPPGNDIDKLHAKLHPTDVELLYSRLSADVIPTIDNQEPLTEDQQELHAKIIAAELERQGYSEDEDEIYDQ